MPPPLPRDPALGAAVRRIRKDRGLAQEALAHRAGMTFATVAKLELAQSAPAWATVRAIAKALDVSMGELGATVDAER